MPELPEVETIVRELREAGLRGLDIVRTNVFWERSISKPSPSDGRIFVTKINVNLGDGTWMT